MCAFFILSLIFFLSLGSCLTPWASMEDENSSCLGMCQAMRSQHQISQMTKKLDRLKAQLGNLKEIQDMLEKQERKLLYLSEAQEHLEDASSCFAKKFHNKTGPTDLFAFLKIEKSINFFTDYFTSCAPENPIPSPRTSPLIPRKKESILLKGACLQERISETQKKVDETEAIIKEKETSLNNDLKELNLTIEKIEALQNHHHQFLRNLSAVVTMPAANSQARYSQIATVFLSYAKQYDDLANTKLTEKIHGIIKKNKLYDGQYSWV